MISLLLGYSSPPTRYREVVVTPLPLAQKIIVRKTVLAARYWKSWFAGSDSFGAVLPPYVPGRRGTNYLR
jgi:hypothetical protein